MSEIKHAVIAEIAPHTYAVNECGMSAMYVLVGKERALCIDTGTGVTNIRKIVEELTDLPYDVILTHVHMDHVGGAPLFDRVYLHRKDQEWLLKMADLSAEQELTGEEERMLLRQMRMGCQNYADALGKHGSYQAFHYDISEIPLYEKLPQFLNLQEGMVFELGDRPVEVLFTPGHTPGSCSLLDHKTRILFSGDACNQNLLLTSGCTVEEALKGLRHLKEREKEFDRNFTGHLGYAGGPFLCSAPKTTLADALEVCSQVVHGTADIRITDETVGENRVKTAEYGVVRITFTD